LERDFFNALGGRDWKAFLSQMWAVRFAVRGGHGNRGVPGVFEATAAVVLAPVTDLKARFFGTSQFVCRFIFAA
jgi:hypothetical protein